MGVTASFYSPASTNFDDAMTPDFLFPNRFSAPPVGRKTGYLLQGRRFWRPTARIGAEDRFDPLHGALTAGTFEGIGSPDAEDEVPPEWAHGAGGDFGRGGDEGDLGFEI